MFSLCGLCWNTDWILYNLLIVNSDRSYISDELLHKLGNVVVTYHKKVREILCFFYSWFDMTSGTTAERQTQTVNLIRQFYAFILNSVSDVIFFFLSKVQVQNTYVSVSVPLKAAAANVNRTAYGDRSSCIVEGHCTGLHQSISDHASPTPRWPGNCVAA